MNFPPGLQFHENNRLLVWRPRGLLDEKVVSDVIAALGRLEMELHEPFNRFSDTAGVEQVDLNYEYVISVALYRRFVYAHRKPIKSAILATHPKFIHYAQMHALLTQGSTIDVRIFPDSARRSRNGSAHPLNCSRRSRSPTLLMKQQAARPNTARLRIADQARSTATQLKASRMVSSFVGNTGWESRRTICVEKRRRFG
jgi:hypothetical protein